MAVLSLQTVVSSGLGATYASAATGGDKVPLAGDNVFLHVKNGGASATTVTITTQNSSYKGLTIPDLTVSVPASGDRFIGPLDPSLQADVNNQASVGYSSSTSVTIAALRI